MSNLSKETIARIEADALRHGEQEHGWDEMSKDYLSGALHEAERAQGLVDALEWIQMHAPIEPIVDDVISAALAKYREVSNG
jgi:hypothetical protein